MNAPANIDKNDLTLIIDRQFSAPVSKVFQAFVDPTKLSQWMGPEGVSVLDCAIDAKIGGEWFCQMKTPDGNTPYVSGVYKEVIPNERLVYTWAWRQEDGSTGHISTITLTFEEKDGGTYLRLEQISFRDEEARDHHEHGWTSSFDCLGKFLAA